MRNNAPLIMVAVLILAGIIGLFAFNMGAADRRLDNSVIGINGLQHVLSQNDMPYKRSHKRLSPHASDLGLRVLPLYDMDVLRPAATPLDDHQKFFQTDLRDIYDENLLYKTTDLPSLIILPKWVQGVIDIKTAHEEALIPEERYQRLFSQTELGGLRLSRGANDMVTRGGISLFLPQTFDADTLPATCKPIRYFGGGVLVAECRPGEENRPYYLLSDPDLINNHGLAVGENAMAALALIRELAPPGDRPVYIDTSPELLITIGKERDERRDYTRDASDFARFFAPPFDALWAILLIVTGIMMWRGAVRFGPVLTGGDDSPEQSKSEAIETNARLLRLTGHDGHMVADFVRGQLADLARQTFGNSSGQSGIARYFAFLARRDAELAKAFQTTAVTLMDEGPTMPPARLFAELATYRTLLERVTDAHDPK